MKVKPEAKKADISFPARTDKCATRVRITIKASKTKVPIKCFSKKSVKIASNTANTTSPA